MRCVHPALGRGVLVERAVPVDVVGSDVEADRRPRRDGVRPVQLEARQLDGDDVERLGVEDRLEDRRADVAGAARPQAGGPQDRREHLHRRRLAVGAGHGQPGRGAGQRTHPPRELDLAPHRDAGRQGAGEERLVGPPPRGGDDEVDGRVRHPADGVGTEGQAGAEDVEDAGPLGHDRALGGLGGVDDEDVGAALQEGVGRREPADAQPGDDDAQPGPPGVAVRQPVEAVAATVGDRGGVLAHQAPTTHSA